jgi:hypothetical protein
MLNFNKIYQTVTRLLNHKASKTLFPKDNSICWANTALTVNGFWFQPNFQHSSMCEYDFRITPNGMVYQARCYMKKSVVSQVFAFGKQEINPFIHPE